MTSGLQRLRRHERWELALSVASIARNLPAGCARCTPSARSKWEENAFSKPPPQSPEYLAFCKSVATRVFPPGWDRRYGSFVEEHVPNSTAREPKRSRADCLWQSRRDEFRSSCLEEQELGSLFSARYKEVLSAGKVRPLVIYDERIDLLAPLHKAMYDWLRRQPWLLCGTVTAERITSVCTGRHQTSVDLVSATDGLYHSVAETILDAAFFTSVKIPRSLRRLAKASLSPLIEVEGGYRRISHGQMMGAYLSFPLLCVQSYCAARWAARFDPRAQFLVNGDDTVISASQAVAAEDYPYGFRLNDKKTIRAENVVELNSTVFLRRGGKWAEVRHLRRGGACSDYQGMMHMAKAVSSRPCWVDAFVRSRIGRAWGFLPSQLGFKTYPSYLRERGLRVKRTFTNLPVQPGQVDSRLRCIVGRDATPSEAEILRSFLWKEGRGGGLKRDEWAPSLGFIRRTYGYRSQPLKDKEYSAGIGLNRRFGATLSFSSFSFVTRPKEQRKVFFLPEGENTEEEEVGLMLLDLWRQAIRPLAHE